MNALDQLLSPALVRALGWTLLHSLWQGAAVAAVLGASLLALRHHSARLRYAVAAAALGLVLLLAGCTLARCYRAAQTEQTARAAAETPWAAAVTETALAAPPHAVPGAGAASPAAASGTGGSVAAQLGRWLGRFEPALPLLVVGWLLGLLAMSLRLLGGLLLVRRLRQQRVRPLGGVWAARLEGLAARAGWRRPVALLESALVQAPLVVGHLRPAILLPLGAVAGLSVAHLEAILAHELAHVLRRDYLLNLLLAAAEVLFFYHPAVWFIGHCLRTERENCCDDAAAALCGGDALRVAQALAALAELSLAPALPPAGRGAQLALSAVGWGSRSALLGRVRRLVGRRARPSVAEGVGALSAALLGLGVVGTALAWAGPAARVVSEAGAPAAAARWAGRLMHVWPPDTTKRVPAPSAPAAPAAPAASGTAAAPAPPPTPPAPPAAADSDEANGRPTRLRRVVVNGRGPQSVVMEKDKKGRVTKLYVNGQEVETGGKTKRKGKAAESRVEIVEAPGSAESRRWVWKDARRDFSFDFDFDLSDLHDPVVVVPPAVPVPPVASAPGRFEFRYDHGGKNWGLSDADLDRIGAEALRSTRRGMEEARRGLEAARRDARLNAAERRKIDEALRKLRLKMDRQRATLRLQLHRSLQPLQELPKLPDNDNEADRRAEREAEAAERAADRAEQEAEREERRQELREQIEEAQQQLRQLEAERRENSLPAPPAPPVPRRGLSQAPPAPPAPPRTDRLRTELRADGLIAANAKSYSVSLNGDDLRVNGKAVPPALRDKYRRLLGATGKGRQQVSISVTD